MSQESFCVSLCFVRGSLLYVATDLEVATDLKL